MRATGLETAPDSVLISSARSGDLHAFSQLWERHQAAAVRFAARLVSRSEAEDLSSEAFASILQALRNGGGPDELFRPYLYITLRNIAIRWSNRDSLPRVPFDVDFDLVVDPASFDDPTVEALDRSLVANAFRTLPRRWQEVLWYTEVEGMKASEVAPILGMTANSVAALSYRAREGFRRTWLETHINDASTSGDCTDAAREFERSVEISPRLAAHLASCANCSTLAATADDVPARLRMVLAPLLLGGVAGGILLDLLAQNAAEQAALASVASAVTTATSTSSSVVAAAHVPHVVTLVLAIATAASIGVATLSGPAADIAWSAPTSTEQPAGDVAATPGDSLEGHASTAPAQTDDPTPTPSPTPGSDTSKPAPPKSNDAGRTPPPPAPAPPAPDTTPPAAPAILTSLDPGSTGPSALSGTAEPGAVVTISDSTSQLGSYVADPGGSWSTGILPLQAYTTQIVVTQTDGAGNQSAPVTIAPGFRPTIGYAPAAPQTASVIEVTAQAWPGAQYRVDIDGVPGPVLMVPPHGQASIYVGFVMAGPHDVTYGYINPATSQFTVPMHYYFEGQ